MPSTTLTPIADLADLGASPKVVRVGGKQIALVRADDRVYAIDNRCPHMGYPLAQGTVKGQTLTCDWHNWKFNLDDGQCILVGSEDVRSYPVTIDAGRVFVDLSDRPVEEQMATQLKSLARGLKRFDADGVARDAARLMALGMLPAEVMRQGAIHNAEREEFGWGHALAVIADCASFTEFYPGSDVAIPVVRALWSSAEPVRRFRERPHAEPSFADREGEAEFRRLIEDEEVDKAEAWLRGALEGGLPGSELSRWLTNAASDHFLGFGHQAIYVYKAHQFAGTVGWDALKQVIPSIVPSITWATRYDKLPEMRKYIARLKSIDHELPGLAAKQGPVRPTFNRERFRNEVLFGKGDAAFEAVHGALSAGIRVDTIARELGIAASERMLRMDLDWETTHDERAWDEGGWLEVTHLLTHANAGRQLLGRGITPEALRHLYHNAWFINYQKRFDGSGRADRMLPSVIAADAAELTEHFRNAVQKRDFDRAMGCVSAWERSGWDTEPLLSAMAHEAVEVDDGQFIMIAHVMKTVHAAIQEHRANRGDADAFLPLMGAVRYMASPRRQRPVFDSALNAVKFVSSGTARNLA